MKIIESTSNPWVKQTKKLHRKKYRDESNLYLIEGEHLLEEAINYQAPLEWVITTEEGLIKYHHLISQVPEDKQVLVPKKILKELSELPTPQEVLAVVSKKESSHKGKQLSDHVLVLDNVQDPGNLGTMIRTADAAGFSTVILGEGTTDMYSSKVQRAMQGSQFHVNILSHVNLSDWVKKAKESGLFVVASALDEQAMSFKELDNSQPTAIIMGNEGQGVSGDIQELANKKVYIPMKGQSESLNVAIAAGILMFHF